MADVEGRIEDIVAKQLADNPTLIEQLLAEEFKRMTVQLERLASQIKPLMEQLIKCEERRIAILGEIKNRLDDRIKLQQIQIAQMGQKGEED